MPHQGIVGPVQGHMIVVAEGDPVHVPGLEEGQDPGQVPEEDPGPVLVPAVVTPGLDQGLVADHVLVPDQGPGQSLGLDLDQNHQLRIKNLGQDHLVKRNLDQSHPWKQKLIMKMKKSVLNPAPDHDQNHVLSQGLELVNAQLREVDLDLRALSKTVNHCLLCCST